MSETATAAPRGHSRILTSIVAGVILAAGVLVKVFSGDAKAAPEAHAAPSPAMTMSAPAAGTLAAAFATTAQLEALATEVRGYRGDVGRALQELAAAQKQLHDVEIRQAVQQGRDEERARTAGYRR